eukprot:scaffold347_cov380-Prasinococcus_capsulatus_cf.AAC.20
MGLHYSVVNCVLTFFMLTPAQLEVADLCQDAAQECKSATITPFRCKLPAKDALTLRLGSPARPSRLARAIRLGGVRCRGVWCPGR